ncbi:MAG: GntR family transcriptional regulator [Candidatus Marinimicrobia bacterium]|nr:GntR family transcriptional regulator [FCB group bacterium]MBL7024492.1 GntR family transcriptional regulator [Candidatus Neomarinimicrobiota bacterium]
MKIIISNADPTPIYEQVVRQIQKQIIAGTLPPGYALPSIRRLAVDLQISVITTKRAYDELERDGFINTVGGKGSFVAEQSQELLTEKKMREVEKILSQAVKEARSLGIKLGDMHVMLDLIYGGE